MDDDKGGKKEKEGRKGEREERTQGKRNSRLITLSSSLVQQTPIT